MAELFGVAAGALSVASLFNNAVDCFEYIQLGRNFDSDYQTCQLRLDFTRLRLSRWGEGIGINHDPRFGEPEPSDERIHLAKRTLEQLFSLMGRAHAQSSDFERAAVPAQMALFDASTNTNPTVVSLRSRMQKVIRGRQDRTCISKKISWALYKKKHLTRLLEDIVELLEGLEAIFPKEEAYKQLAASEAGGIAEAPGLQLLVDAAEDDDLLRDAATERLRSLGVNTIDRATVSDAAEVRVGNDYVSQSPFHTGMQTKTNRIGHLDASGTSRIHVGDVYRSSLH